LKAIRKAHEAEIRALKDDKERAVRLAELNVEMGVHNLMASHIVEEAIKSRNLQVHGTIYDVACGRMRDLGVGTDASIVAKSGSLSFPDKLATGGPNVTVDEEVIEIVSGNHGMLKFNGEEATLAVV
jgi:carbonic anhydrase